MKRASSKREPAGQSQTGSMEFLRKGETVTMMRLHANYVSASMAGDYYSATFEEEGSGQLETPYLIIQRQFEDPRDNSCYIETHNPEYCGHFRGRRIEFTVERLLVELDRPRDNLISVTFSMAPADFEAASRVINGIAGQIEPDLEQ
jgi:hypothetical protein